MTKQEMAAWFAVAGKAFPKSKIVVDLEMIDVWQQALEDIPLDLAKKGLLKLMATETFFPSIADIRKACAEVARMSRGEGEMTPGEAWGIAIKAGQYIGFYRGDEAREKLNGDIWDAISDLGGWQTFCMTEESEYPIVRAQFERYFNARQARKHNAEILPPALIGSSTQALPDITQRQALDLSSLLAMP